MQETITVYTIGTSGQDIEFDPSIEFVPDVIILAPDGATSLADNVTFSFANNPKKGTKLVVGWKEGFTINAYKVEILGVVISQAVLQHNGFQVFEYIDDSGNFITYTAFSLFDFNGALGGGLLTANSVALSKLVSGTSAQVIVCNGSGVPVYVAMGGDVSISNTGTVTIANSAITNAKISASAAIDRTKLASGTPNFLVINNGSGVMSETQFVPKANGGFGASVAASTGFTKWNSGTLDISGINDEKFLPVISFESGEQCDNTFTIGHPCTLTRTNMSSYVVKAISGSDNGVITIAKNGTPIANGTITFTAGAVLNAAGTIGAFADTPFAAGDTISLIAEKITAGGKCNVTLPFTRTQ